MIIQATPGEGEDKVLNQRSSVGHVVEKFDRSEKGASLSVTFTATDRAERKELRMFASRHNDSVGTSPLTHLYSLAGYVFSVFFSRSVEKLQFLG